MQIAQDLGLGFCPLSCTEGVSESKFVGKTDVDGNYLASDFVAAFEGSGRFAETGAVILLDEVDACDPNTALCINAATSDGGILPVPDRRDNPLAKRDPRTLIICAANTWGTGVDVEFSGRNALDQAFRDRFVGLGLFVDYDRQREAGIARTYGIEPLGEALWQIRANVREAKVRRAVSTRAWVNLGKLHAIAGMSYQACLDRFLTGWSEAEKAKALQGVRLVEAEAEPMGTPNNWLT